MSLLAGTVLAGPLLAGAIPTGSVPTGSVPTWTVLTGSSPPSVPVRISRIDVSDRPRISLILTAPAGPAGKPPLVRVAGVRAPATVRPLSAGDLSLVLAPDRRGPAERWHHQQTALARFLLTLPTGVRTTVLDGAATEGGSPPADLLASAQTVMALPQSSSRPAADRLEKALDSVGGGQQVRRVVVLVVAADGGRTDPARLHRLRQRLLASGTELYLVDAGEAGAPALAGLAADSGGAVLRTGSAISSAALAPIRRDLASEYHVTFTVAGALPADARLSVSDRTGRLHGITVRIPRTNPAPPPEAPAARPGQGSSAAGPGLPPDAVFLIGAALLVALGVGYGATMLLASRCSPRQSGSRRRSAGTGPAPDGLFFVFLLPCLNEDRVILASLERLAAVPGGNHAALVIDDGSDDDTAAQVESVLSDRIWLLRRTPPEARQGKGEALNAAIRHLLAGDRLAGRNPDDVIIVVVDADGRLDPHALAVVAPTFADPRVGGVQIGVRINNRFTSLLARLQDMEFVIYTDVFQRGRRHLGSVGMGGNGQFMRLSALLSLEEGPWTRSLTEDLDLGIRLLNRGWRNDFCPAAAVHQQGVTELRRLVRQRSRWFQGHLQSWKLVPEVLSSAPRRAAADLVYHLTSPALLLIGSLLTLSFLLSLLAAAVALIGGNQVVGWWLASTYSLSFGPALAYSLVYWGYERRQGMPLLKALGLAHVYVLYGLMWSAAGWRGLGRHLRGRTGWAKTERVVEGQAATAALPPAGRRAGT